MTTRWKLYWGALVASLLSVALWRTKTQYKTRSNWFVTGKAAIDTTLVVLLAAFCPPLLIAYCTLWLSQFVSASAWLKTTVSIGAGLILTVAGGLYLEIVAILGLFAIDVVTGDFVKRWQKLGDSHV